MWCDGCALVLAEEPFRVYLVLAGRMGPPEEIAAALAFLASDQSCLMLEQRESSPMVALRSF